ncbi:ExeA family protein [Falsirhodobacter deserti]|uniref:ExeA family protein n=1 Tax=Falsirhodobacter deserti TaxID=1365611 RepID=UPI001F4E5073|nr:AAA family ATPase [Falsirhodobacter deserti]
MSISNLYTMVYKLRERPFTLLPDPDFLFWTPKHLNAYTALQYGVQSRSPITVITGDVGVGKTTLLQALLREMSESATIGLISNAQGGRGELLRWTLNAFSVDVPAGADYVGLFQTLQNFLLKEYAEGRHVILVIDEAQNLSVEALEELRMLTNINSNKDELLQLVLVGQPELREMVERPNLSQFAQRVGASFHLTGLDAEGTTAYIHHRLRHAGGTGEEIPADAIELIHEAAEGIPRLVNKICDLAMVYGSTRTPPGVSADVVRGILVDGLFIRTRKAVDPNSADQGVQA